MEILPLKYTGCTVAFQEVPGETSLVFNISGCPYMCKGCHSQYLWDYAGKYISDDIDNVLLLYKDLVTCVCFMGGDQNKFELKRLLAKCKSLGLKTCIYTGSNDKTIFYELFDLLDYFKIGEYVNELGGLSSKNTNQRFYQITFKEARQFVINDITHLFWNKNIL